MDGYSGIEATDYSYIDSDGVHLCVASSGNLDAPPLVIVPGVISNLALNEFSPYEARFFEPLARFTRLIRYDRRGAGLSDRGVDNYSFEQQLHDLHAVVASLHPGSKPWLLGLSWGATISLAFLARNPGIAQGVIPVNGLCGDKKTPDEAEGDSLLNWDDMMSSIREDYFEFTNWLAEACFPDQPPHAKQSAANHLRISQGPEGFRVLWNAMRGLDLRKELRKVDCKALVIQSRGDRVAPPSHSDFIAAQLNNSSLLQLETSAHLPYFDPTARKLMLPAIEQFITGRSIHTLERSFAVILFSDIVGSTKGQVAQGDTRWRALVSTHERETANIVERYEGRVVKFQGDGVMALFATPSAAFEAAVALREATRRQGTSLRIGINAGEIVEDRGDVFGTPINVAARVASLAGGSTILVTDATRALVEGSEYSFGEKSIVNLKGLGDYAVCELT